MPGRVHVPGSSALELHTTTNSYLPSGEVIGITRTSSSGAAAVARTVQFDSLGRMVTNTDPNVGTWRYAYNANGEIVGTSDARGCGVNYFYEAAGRVVAEDYSPCLASHQAYSAPDVASGNGSEVFYRYDTPDNAITSSPALAADAGVPSGEVILNGCVVNPALLLGRVASVSDRGTRVVNGYDGRGRVNCVAKQMALPGAPNSVVASRYAPRWYEQNVTFDAADRPVTTSTGATQVVDATGHSTVTSVYSRRGTVASVSSGYGPLVTGILRSADGPVNVITYGDKAATTTAMTYDARRRLEQVVTSRGAPVSWAPVAVSATPSVFQQTLANTMYTYDSVDNPVQIDDYRNPTEWPAGAQPVTRKIAYDDLNRATNIAYEAAAGADTWVDPYAPEDTGSTTDVRLANPSPHVSFTNRIENQSYRYDWLGNLTNTGDDVGGFYDRSLGAQSNGGTGVGPYQMTAAAGGVAPRDGSLTVAYDAMGNMSGMSVVRNAAAPCLPSGASCSQRYAYDWDELGRLAKARRWDGASLGVATTALPTTTPAVELDYGYDASDNRTLKTAWDSAGNQLQTVYIFGSLELRRTSVAAGDYVVTTATEVPYLFAHGVRLGRVHYAPSAGLTSSPTPVHVLLELPDSLGSSSIVLDQGTGELVESTTYQGYGGTESDYRPSAWAGFREDYRFTGKEEDVEVGLQYFGKRYLAPSLGRWISPDPLAVHAPGSADLNLYAYVHGGVLRATDPLGLDSDTPDAGAPAPRDAGPPETAGVNDVLRLPEVTIRGKAPDRGDPVWFHYGEVTPKGGGGDYFGTGVATPLIVHTMEHSDGVPGAGALGEFWRSAESFHNGDSQAGWKSLALGVASLATDIVAGAAKEGGAAIKLGVDGVEAARAAAEASKASEALTVAGQVHYGANGVEAVLTKDMIGTGTPAARGIRPPGYVPDQGLARGHLLAKVLGGSGTEARNLVTLIQSPVNSPVMRDFEAAIRAAVEEGQTVNFGAMPIYQTGSAMPVGVTIVAEGSDGFGLAVTILNRR